MHSISTLFSLAAITVSTTLALPQFEVTNVDNGILPSSEIPTAALTAWPTGTPVSSYSTSDLEALWATVEETVPVETSHITTVLEPETNFTIPETPALPPSLQDHAPADLKFPSGFLYGVASAAGQYEGGVKADGRGPSRWDYTCHTDPAACNNYTPDITDNGRYMYKQDIARIKAMGSNAYSFTVSWSRVIPFGSADSPINEEGLQYYDDVVDECIKNGIKPVVTLFHWDEPLNLLFKYGAFLNESIVPDFVRYAEVVFKRLGDRVDTWYTVNEPQVYCSYYAGDPYTEYYSHYTTATLNYTTAPYPCTYHILTSHGHVVKKYRDLVAAGKVKSGQIAMKNDDSYPVPRNESSPADHESAKRHFQFYIGIFSDPIYGTGDYPQVVKDTIPAEILPRFTEEQKKLIHWSADFYASDAYCSGVSTAAPGGIDACAGDMTNANWPVCEEVTTEAMYSTLEGFGIGVPSDPHATWLLNTAHLQRRHLRLLKEYYNFDKIYISEFGFARPFEYLYTEKYQQLTDADRVAYMNDYLYESLLAIHEDSIPLAGVFAWSFVDNFEWDSGMDQRFGMQYVNFTSLERTPKLSLLSWRDFGKKHLS